MRISGSSMAAVDSEIRIIRPINKPEIPQTHPRRIRLLSLALCPRSTYHQHTSPATSQKNSMLVWVILTTGGPIANAKTTERMEATAASVRKSPPMTATTRSIGHLALLGCYSMKRCRCSLTVTPLQGMGTPSWHGSVTHVFRQCVTYVLDPYISLHRKLSFAVHDGSDPFEVGQARMITDLADTGSSAPDRKWEEGQSIEC